MPRIVFENIHRFASKAPNLDISSSDPVDTATGVAINKTITLTFSMPLHPPSVDNTNISGLTVTILRLTLSSAVTLATFGVIVSNLAGATSYTVTMTIGLGGLYGPWKLTPAATDSISFTTA